MKGKEIKKVDLDEESFKDLKTYFCNLALQDQALGENVCRFVQLSPVLS